jgi:hypothetical protein
VWLVTGILTNKACGNKQQGKQSKAKFHEVS